LCKISSLFESPSSSWNISSKSVTGNGVDPYGTWQVYIVTTGTVSTTTARMTVNYMY